MHTKGVQNVYARSPRSALALQNSVGLRSRGLFLHPWRIVRILCAEVKDAAGQGWWFVGGLSYVGRCSWFCFLGSKYRSCFCAREMEMQMRVR
jgi:hypothetical protein